MRCGVAENALYLSRSVIPIQEAEQRGLNHVPLHAAWVSAAIADERCFSIRMNGNETSQHARADVTELVAGPADDLLGRGKYFASYPWRANLIFCNRALKPWRSPRPQQAPCAVEPVANSANVVSSVSSAACVGSPRTTDEERNNVPPGAPHPRNGRVRSCRSPACSPSPCSGCAVPPRSH